MLSQDDEKLRYRSEKLRANEPLFVRVTGSGTGGIASLIFDGAGFASKGLMSLRLDTMLRCRPTLREAAGGDLLYGKFYDSFGRFVDEVIVSVVDAKESSTRNPQVELSCHGGAGSVAAVEAALLEAGFIRGRATALLERAQLNGMISLLAVEAQIRLSRAMTPRQAEFLLGFSMLQQKWERLGFEMAMGLRTRDLGWQAKLLSETQTALKSGRTAQALLKEHRVVIVGPVNAGKSTLANTLARSERHIVSPIAGTTLDVLNTSIDLRGLHVLLTDTAGLRELFNAEQAEQSAESVEKLGQSRGVDAAAMANLRLCVLDGSCAPTETDVAVLERLLKEGPTLLVLNKVDLGVHPDAQGLSFVSGIEPIMVSGQSGQGIRELESAIENFLLYGSEEIAASAEADLSGGLPFTRRQLSHIQAIQTALETGVEGTEFLVHLRQLIGTRPDEAELSVVLEEGNS